MRNEKFTQGEWEHCILGGESGYPYVFEKKSGEGIATVFIQQGDTENAQANAALIAAAPEMYQNNEQTLTELEQMIPAMLAVCADCNHRNCKVCRFAKVLKTASEMERRIEQVQKKARGQE